MLVADLLILGDLLIVEQHQTQQRQQLRRQLQILGPSAQLGDFTLKEGRLERL